MSEEKATRIQSEVYVLRARLACWISLTQLIVVYLRTMGRKKTFTKTARLGRGPIGCRGYAGAAAGRERLRVLIPLSAIHWQ